jgi:GABA(A) receptor-associated protein
MCTSYKQQKTHQDRLQESADILRQFPGHIPVIIEAHPRSSLSPPDRPKLLVPSDLTVGQFLFVVRKRVQIGPSEALFVVLNGKIPYANSTMGTLYLESKDPDGFLYVTYSSDSAYG